MILVDAVVDQTAKLDVYTQETRVARVQRAVRGERWPIEAGVGRAMIAGSNVPPQDMSRIRTALEIRGPNGCRACGDGDPP
jgi:hypothetical protein